MEAYSVEALGIRIGFYLPADAQQDKDAKLTFLDHSHSFYELHIIEAGEYRFTAENQQYSLKPGQFCLIGPNVIHSPKHSDASLCRICMNLEYRMPTTGMGRWLQMHSREQRVWVGSAAQMLPLLEEIRKEQTASLSLSQAALESLFGLLMIRLAREVGMEEKTTGFQGQEDTRSLYIDRFLNNRFDLAAGEEILAQELNLSRRQLDRIIQKQYGMSFRQKRSQIRFAIACDLLRNTGQTVAQISEELGYSTPSNFTAFFKEIQGMTPGAYRAQFTDTENKT